VTKHHWYSINYSTCCAYLLRSLCPTEHCCWLGWECCLSKECIRLKFLA